MRRNWKRDDGQTAVVLVALVVGVALVGVASPSSPRTRRSTPTSAVRKQRCGSRRGRGGAEEGRDTHPNLPPSLPPSTHPPPAGSLDPPGSSAAPLPSDREYPSGGAPYGTPQ